MEWPGSWYSRRSAWFRRLLLLSVSLAMLFGLFWFTPTSYYITAPGAAIDTSRLISVPGGRPHADNLYMLIITTQPANLFWYLYARADSRAELETREQFLGTIPDYDKYLELTRRMMADSQRTAKALALREMGYGKGVEFRGARVTDLSTDSPSQGFLQKEDVITEAAGMPVRRATELREVLKEMQPGAGVALRVRRGAEQVSLTVPTGEHPERKGSAALGVFLMDDLAFDIPVGVEIETGAITGPSAGLMFTLQIIDQLTPGGITGDLKVAGTGTIEADGSVGIIGGVRQKVYTAEAAGAGVIFVPRGNYPDAARAATSIQVVAVDTLQDALNWLRKHAQKAGHTGPAFWQ